MPVRPVFAAVPLAVALIAPRVAVAQDTTATLDSSTTAATAAGVAMPPWITRRQLMVGGAAVVSTVILGQFDRQLSDASQQPRWQNAHNVRNAAHALSFLGGPGPFAIGAGFALIGDATSHRGATEVGFRVTESVLLAASITAIGKGFFGRALPGVQTSQSFSFGRGFHDGNGPFVSFPSGHTAAGFALAAAISGETESASPSLARFVTPVSYVTASAIGVARIYQHVHWPSDLPLAAAIGTWSGMTIESRHKAAASRGLKHTILAGTTVVPNAQGGAMVTWSSLLASGR